MMSAQDKLRKARAGLILDNPFFGALALRLEPKADESRPTLATDGKLLRFNPAFVDATPLPILKSCLAHEVLHVAAGHCWRRGKRDVRQWNVAGDYAVNGILAESGFQLPDGALRESAYRNMATEGIFADLGKRQGQGDGQSPQAGGSAPGGQNGPNGPKSEKPGPEDCAGKPIGNGKGQQDGQNGQAPAPDPGGMGAVEDSPAPGPGENPPEQDWRVAVAQAAQAAKAMGKLPGGLARLVSEIVEPRVDWRAALRDFVQRAARNDYDWRRPNRRFVSQGIILPSLLSDELPTLAVAVDTSGSIDEKTELPAFAAEIGAILQEYQTTITLLYCDSKVQGQAELTREDLPLRLKPKGGGGTDFRPVFEALDASGESPAALVYLTDLYGPFPEVEPDFPVLWVSTSDRRAPFGETVRLHTH